MKKNKIIILALFSVFLSNCKQGNIIDSSFISQESVSEIISSSEEISSEVSESIDSSISSESSEFIDEKTYYYFDENITLYINPSVQYANLYVDNLGNEGKHMNDISILLVSMLDKYTNITVYSNNSIPGLSLSNSINQSNEVKADYHLAIHSNAGGGSGSEIFYTKTSYNFSKSILDSLNEVLPYKTRGLKDGSKSLYELKKTTGSACLLEILFHDEIKQATFIIDNKELIATAIYEGIISYFLEK